MFAAGKFIVVSDADPMLVSCLNCSPNNLSEILVVVVVVFVVVTFETLYSIFFVVGESDDDYYRSNTVFKYKQRNNVSRHTSVIHHTSNRA